MCTACTGMMHVCTGTHACTYSVNILYSVCMMYAYCVHVCMYVCMHDVLYACIVLLWNNIKTYYYVKVIYCNIIFLIIYNWTQNRKFSCSSLRLSSSLSEYLFNMFIVCSHYHHVWFYHCDILYQLFLF